MLELISFKYMKIGVPSFFMDTNCYSCSKHVYGEPCLKISHNTGDINLCEECTENVIDNGRTIKENIEFDIMKEIYEGFKNKFDVFNVERDCCIVKIKDGEVPDQCYVMIKKCSVFSHHESNCTNHMVIFGNIRFCSKFFKKYDDIISEFKECHDESGGCSYCDYEWLVGSNKNVYDLEHDGTEVCETCKEIMEDILDKKSNEIKKRLILSSL